MSTRMPRVPWWRPIALAVFSLTTIFLLTEHTAHVFGALPYLLILACPLMHLFHGHGGHAHRHGNVDDRTRSEGT